MAKLASHKRRVIDIMKRAGVYSPFLTVQIDNLANALHTLDMCNAQKNEEGFTPVIKKPTRDGVQYVEHPIFKVEERTRNSIDRQMRQLGLTVSDLIGSPDIPDNADELLDKMNRIK